MDATKDVAKNAATGREQHVASPAFSDLPLGTGPVVMPELPARLVIRSPDQYKAIADPTRRRILGILQNEPATAKQLADRLKVAPGTAAHHLQVLEKAGLAKIVALRKVRGIIAKYYTRTARIFANELPPELMGAKPHGLEVVDNLRDEFAEALADFGPGVDLYDGLARARLSHERAEQFKRRLGALFDEFIAAAPDAEGQVYSLGVALFQAPAYLQRPASASPASRGHNQVASAAPEGGDAES
jgi:DNA-binding transcriptional ArsR family regulator